METFSKTILFKKYFQVLNHLNFFPLCLLHFFLQKLKGFIILSQICANKI